VLFRSVIVTSKQGVLSLKNYSPDWERLKCICVSESTAKAALESGAKEIEVGDGYGHSIVNVLKAKKRCGKWLYLRPKVIASEWVADGRKSGFEIDEVVVYETMCNKEVSNFQISQDGVLIFTSPSTIRCFLQNHPILPSHEVVVIGKTTQNALPDEVKSHLSDTTSVEAAVDMACKIASKG
jgi:uroporphyrinogen-III synthase